MNYKVAKLLVIARQWANTESGERTLMRVISTACIMLAVSTSLLIIGTI